MCPWEHTINPEGVVTTDKDQVFSASDVEHSVTLPKVSSWVVIDITAIRSPNHFYVNFPFGVLPLEQYKELTNGKDEGYSESISSWENFENLLEQLNEHYSRMTYRNVDLTEFALGEIIIAKFSTDGSWNRAKVINSNSDLEKVEVFYVDFGNAEWVSEKDTRRIELKFMQMPFLAVECFLNNVEPASDNGIWSKEARNLFSQLTEGRTLFANVISKGSNSTVFLDLYDTSGNEEVNIGEELRKAGFAKKTEGLCTKKKVEGITYLPG